MPKDQSSISYNNAQSVVDYVWNQLELQHPPKIYPLAKQNVHAEAKGSRCAIYIRENVATWVLLHEISHALTSNHEYSDLHGADFVGMYFKLLERFLNIPGPYMLFTLKQSNININLAAKPWNI